MKCKNFVSIPVFSVLLLVGIVYCITVFIFIEDWVGLRSSTGTLNASIFTLLGCLCLFCFFVCVLTDPGHVPSSYVPDVEETLLSDQEPHIKEKDDLQFHTRLYELLMSSESRKCDKCCNYKPPRAHHCRVCRRCVLRMDHHCLWINNCVGYRNYKAFFILVLNATVATLYSSVILIICSFQLNFRGKLPLKLFYVLSGVMMFSLSIALGTLLGWHFYLITQNMTTIEYYEGIRAAWLAKKSGQNYRHPFDIGVYKNITLVLGPNMLKWLCPTACDHLKDGMSFPTSHDG